MLFISAIATQATTYQVKYDILNKGSISFTVKEESGKLTVRNNNTT